MDAALIALDDALRDATNIAGHARSTQDYLIGFFSWHEQTELRLRGSVAPEDVERLLFSPRIWALRQIDVTAASARAWAELELAARCSGLERARTELRTAKERWRSGSAVFLVPDTNVLMEHEKTLMQLPWQEIYEARHELRVVLPLLVIDELDGLKRRGRDGARSRAQTILKEISAADILGRFPRCTLQTREFGRTISLEIFNDDLSHVRLTDPDSEIVDRCLHLTELTGQKVVLVTYDVGMAVRAENAGVEVQLLP
jgi:rRNA-processing protein FCF1